MLQEQAAAGNSSTIPAVSAPLVTTYRLTGEPHTSAAIATQAPAIGGRTIDGRTVDGRTGSATAEEEAQPSSEEEEEEDAAGGDAGSDAAGAPLLPVNGPTIVTADGRFTAWRAPGPVSSHLATCDPKVAVSNFWRHEVNCGCNLQMLWLSHGADLLRSAITFLPFPSSHLRISPWSTWVGVRGRRFCLLS